MKYEHFALRVEIGWLYVFACSIYVALDMNGACQTYKDCLFQIRGAFDITIIKKSYVCNLAYNEMTAPKALNQEHK